MLIGAVGGLLVVPIVALDKMRIDDPVGAISVHGTCGIWGLMAVLITTDGATLAGQLTGLGVILGFTFAAALVVWFVIKMIFGIRLSEEDQMVGADAAEIGIVAYLNSPVGLIAIGSAETRLRVKSRLRAAFCVLKI